jgi:hypothetical protein
MVTVVVVIVPLPCLTVKTCWLRVVPLIVGLAAVSIAELALPST